MFFTLVQLRASKSTPNNSLLVIKVVARLEVTTGSIIAVTEKV